MRLTPLDIHHKEFNHALRGYNEAEVDEFLDEVADELERLFKENIDLSERIEALEEKVHTYQDMERTLNNTLLSAQKSADEIKQKAEREADAVLKEAEVKAKEIIHSALINKQKTTAELGRIKRAEEEFRATFRALLEKHLAALAEVSLPDDMQAAVEETVEDVPRGGALRQESWDMPVTPGEEPQAPVNGPGREAPAPEERAVEEPPEPPGSGFVASLHLGDLGEAEIEPDATVEFDVAEFGFGEREDDTDIEEID